MKRLFRAAAIVIITLCALNANAVDLTYSDPVSDTYRSLVYNPGDYNSGFYRIPALITLPDGTLVSVADKRINTISDLPGDIDVVCRRSTDGGRTWGPYITVATHDSFGGYGDPALVYDRRTGDILVISLHGHGPWSKTPGRISVSRSRDKGLTWEAPVDINPQILTSNPEGSQPIKCAAAFASSGRALQTADGRILFVLVTRKDGVEGFPCYAIYSDDSGRTWNVSENPATLNGDESKIAQLPDGSLLMSIRNRYSGMRKFSASTDGGRTWKEYPADWSSLHDVACNGDFIPVKHNGRDYLLQSLPAGPWRSNITVYASADGGRTWPSSYRVTAAPGAYSAMTILPDGSLGIMTEEGVHNAGKDHTGGYRIWFTRIPLDKIIK